MERIGKVFVDAGIVMVGDPCYSLPDDGSHRISDWDEFCKVMFKDENYDKGYSKPLGDGVAIVVESGYGDGEYPVFVERASDGRVSRLIVEFIPEYDDEDEECLLCSNPANGVSAYCDDCDSQDEDE